MSLKNLRYALDTWTCYDREKPTDKHGVACEPIVTAMEHWGHATAFAHLAKTGEIKHWWELPS